MNDASERLNKRLALLAGLSRRAADELIERGRVTVNGEVTTLGARVSPEDEISVNGKAVDLTVHKRYVAFHKPTGYVCSRRDQGDAPTIYSILPKGMYPLKPVGRLDRDSSGILLLSNDGDFAFRMTHPQFRKTKIYEVILDIELAPLHQQMISDHGISLEDGVSKLQLERLDDTLRTGWRVTMYEGRNRQIRRTFNALGYSVIELHRTTFGNYTLDQLRPGEYRDELI